MDLIQFRVFQQLYPRVIGVSNSGDEIYEARLEEIGLLSSRTAHEAIQRASKWKEFQQGQQLGKFPIVQEVV